jgi:nitrilase
MSNSSLLKVGMAQISPVWLDMEKTRDKINGFIERAGQEGCDLVVSRERQSVVRMEDR